MRWSEREYPPADGDGGSERSPNGTDTRALPMRRAAPHPAARQPAGEHDTTALTVTGWVVAALVVILLVGAAAARGGTLGGPVYYDPLDEVPVLAEPQDTPRQQSRDVERCLQDWLGDQEDFAQSATSPGDAPIVLPPPRPAC